MDPTRDDGQMDCTEPPADDLGPEIAAMDVCVAAENPKEIERSADEERSLTGVSEKTTVQPQDKNERYNRNLEKFLNLENGKASLEMRSRRKKVSDRLIKSDGVVETKVDYQGNVSKISSILSEVRLERSSAPPTYETASRRQNPETKEIEVANRQSTTKESVGIPPGNLETSIFLRTRWTPGPAHAPSNSQTPSKNFKTPVPPPACSTPKPSFTSPGTSTIREGYSTPTYQRPTNFILKPRKSYYMFSPDDSGILRQCQSMPEINRRQREAEKYQRRSLAPEDRARIVRSLFPDPPGPATPETRRSMVPKSHIPASLKEAVAKEAKGRSSLGSIRSNACRKLTFAPPNTSAAPIEEGNVDDAKRKEISPPFAECPPTSVKKVRISPKAKKKDVGMGSDIRGQESNVPGEISDVPRETEESPAKRKTGESSSPKKK